MLLDGNGEIVMSCPFSVLFLKDNSLFRFGFPTYCATYPRASRECLPGSLEPDQERKEASNYKEAVNHVPKHH